MLKNWSEVKNYLKERIDSEQLSQFEIIEKAGLSRDTYYKLFAPDRITSPMRKSTVLGLAKALRLEVQYENDVPQFNDIGTGKVSGAEARDAIKEAVQIAGSVQNLAKLINISSESLYEILDPSNYGRDVPFELIIAIGSKLKRAVVFNENGISLPPFDQALPNDLIESDRDKSGIRVLRLDNQEDSGLLELMQEEYLFKYEITGDEVELLSQISVSRKSNATLSQWVSILYALRGLDSKG